MADLVKTLSSLYSGGDMTVFQATVDAVGTGVVTIHVNGGSFTDVPFLDSYVNPAIGDACYVIGRKDWGMLVLGRPAEGPERSGGDGAVITWQPYARATYRSASGTWAVPSSDVMSLQPGDASSIIGCYFYRISDIVVPATGLSTASFYLAVDTFDTGEVALDNAYLELGLFTNAAPTGGPLTMVANVNATYKVRRLQSGYVSIPLDWASRLLNGSAKGIYVLSSDYPAQISGPGTARLTAL
jgi:hypothetical protein